MSREDNNQTSAIDIPTTKTTHVVATASSDGHTMLSSIVTDFSGHQRRQSSMSSNEEYGISPTYYSNGKQVHTSQSGMSHPLCSPVHGDSSRVFFTHNKSCSCRGSGVGCECTKTCSC